MSERNMTFVIKSPYAVDDFMKIVDNYAGGRGVERQVESMNIQRIGDRIVLNVFSVLFAIQQENSIITVTGMLLAFIISCFGIYIKKKLWIFLSIVVFLILSMIFPVFVVFYPVLFYEALSLCQEEQFRRWPVSAMVVMAMKVCLGLESLGVFGFSSEICSFGMAFWLHRNSDYMESVTERYFRTQDSSTEMERKLKKENRYLLEKQDNDIYTATLRERNRIAREIHDNVGHMLSRGILMTGALLTMAKEETVRSGLLGLKDCLDEAMTNIRQSVHDLHDDSIDLKQSMENLFQNLAGFQVDFEYDMPREIPRKVKYCLLAIVKEAVSNTIRHSNGDRMEIIVQEHPAFYKLSVADNGCCSKGSMGDGIGLYNIRERVEQLHGTLHISSEKTGFCIHVSIPKSDEKDMEG